MLILSTAEAIGLAGASFMSVGMAYSSGRKKAEIEAIYDPVL